MDKRLTPYLRRRVMELGEKMNALSGVDIRGRGRTRPEASARMVFTLVARLEGITQEEIATYLGLDHSTVSYGEKRMREAMSVPKAYPELINLYNRYTELTV